MVSKLNPFEPGDRVWCFRDIYAGGTLQMYYGEYGDVRLIGPADQEHRRMIWLDLQDNVLPVKGPRTIAVCWPTYLTTDPATVDAFDQRAAILAEWVRRWEKDPARKTTETLPRFARDVLRWVRSGCPMEND